MSYQENQISNLIDGGLLLEKEQKQLQDVIQSLDDYEKEIFEHNQNILKGIYNEDFKELMDGCTCTGKIEWSDAPDFKPEYKHDVYGIFTLEYVDQWSVGMEGDSYEGFMYIRVDGYDKYLKLPYSC